MSTELQKSDRVSVKSLIESPAYAGRLRQLMGERAPQFVTSLVQVSQDWKLSKCDPHSVIAAAITAGALDLPISPFLGFAFIVPYGDKAQFQLGYKGLVQLAVRSGQYKRLNVTEVYDGELMKYDRVKGDVVLDETKRKEKAEVVGYVAYFELINGAEHAEYWSMETVKNHAQRFSQAYRAKKQDSPWFTDFNAMAKKTVLKSLISHWGPMSTTLQNAVVEDQGFRPAPDGSLQYPDNTPPITETEPVFNEEKPKRGRQVKSTVIPIPSEPAVPESEAAPAQSEPIGTIQQGLARVLVEAGVSFDDFADFAVNQGIARNIRDFPDFESLPKPMCEVLASPAILSKIIRVYGNKKDDTKE